MATSTRDRLLDAAASVIARKGYQAASLAEVGREAGLTTGAVYSNFRNKEELFLEAVNRLQRPPQLEAEGTGAPPRLAELRQEVLRQLRLLDSSPHAAALMMELGVLAMRDEAVRDHVATGLRRTRDVVRAALDERPSASELARRLSPDERATLLVAALNGLYDMRLYDPEQVPAGLIERVFDLLSD